MSSLDLFAAGNKTQSAWMNLKDRKQAEARRILASPDWQAFTTGADLWNRLEVVWLTHVGQHVNDMDCGTLMHGLHTRDRQQVIDIMIKMSNQ